MTEVRTTSSTGGEKGVKEARFDLIPVKALETVATLYGRGAKKYSEHNWRKGYEWSKSYAAMQRHLTAFWGGEDIDPEMGLPHLACAIFHAMTLLTFMEEQREFDDRFVGPRTLEQVQSEEAIALLREKLLGNSEDPIGDFPIHNNMAVFTTRTENSLG
ncbi:hypothetical protein SEA_ZEINA_43 [Arthrobacter phage Zeina]|nr:hypothetical protein SEA_ZEINA_43 [Arthrobacter phage Zeina]